MPKEYDAPLITQKNQIKRFKFKVPLLNQESINIDKKELTQPQIEHNLLH